MRTRPGRRRSAPDAPHLTLDDIQGNILRPYRHEAMTYVFLSVVEPKDARQWLGELAAQITTAAVRTPRLAVNLAVTHAGLRRLGVAPTLLSALPEAFRQGMAARAAMLGDPVRSVEGGSPVPVDWHDPFGPDGDLDLMLMVSGDPADVAAKVDELEHDFWQSGVTQPEPTLTTGAAVTTGRIETGRLPGGIEHFGYRDGLSQPAVEGVHRRAVTGTGRLVDGGWVPLKAGEFVLGMPAEDGAVVDDVPALTAGGSYLVLRKLEQDVGAFRALVARAAEEAGLDPELIQAKLMGRWPDGTSLMHSRTDPGEPREELPSNDFDYGADPVGAVCPLGSHVRRANPRASTVLDGGMEYRRRIIRRGMPYGPLYSRGTEDADRGLVFACYQADIAGQFELVQSEWLNDGNVFALGADRDPVVGECSGGSGRMRLEADPAAGVNALVDAADPDRGEQVYLTVDSSCVQVRGGEYFLVPSRSAITWLSRLGTTDPVPAPRRSGERPPESGAR